MEVKERERLDSGVYVMAETMDLDVEGYAEGDETMALERWSVDGSSDPAEAFPVEVRTAMIHAMLY